MRADAALIFALLGVYAITAVAFADDIGRTNPSRASLFRPPSFNFQETYTDGEILGIAIGSTRADAIEAAERAGLTVSPGGWGDNRAGGAKLYSRPALRHAMSRQPHLNYYDASDPKRGLTMRFRGNRVVSVKLHYINFEAI